MADAPPQQQLESTSTGDTNPFVAFFSNFLKLFHLPFSFLPPASKTEPVDYFAVASHDTKANPVATEVAAQNKKPSIVRYPHPRQSQKDVLPLKIEGYQERETNPSTVCQVYALGGFLVLSWAWRRWNEQKGSKKSPEENPPSPDS